MRGADTAGIKARFVMRGLGSVAEDEAQEHDDIVFVKASNTMSKLWASFAPGAGHADASLQSTYKPIKYQCKN